MEIDNHFSTLRLRRLTLTPVKSIIHPFLYKSDIKGCPNSYKKAICAKIVVWSSLKSCCFVVHNYSISVDLDHDRVYYLEGGHEDSTIITEWVNKTTFLTLNWIKDVLFMILSQAKCPTPLDQIRLVCGHFCFFHADSKMIMKCNILKFVTILLKKLFT